MLNETFQKTTKCWECEIRNLAHSHYREYFLWMKEKNLSLLRSKNIMYPISAIFWHGVSLTMFRNFWDPTFLRSKWHVSRHTAIPTIADACSIVVKRDGEARLNFCYNMVKCKIFIKLFFVLQFWTYSELYLIPVSFERYITRLESQELPPYCHRLCVIYII